MRCDAVMSAHSQNGMRKALLTGVLAVFATPALAQGVSPIVPVPPQGSPLPGVAAPEAPRVAAPLTPNAASGAAVAPGAAHQIKVVTTQGFTGLSPEFVAALTAPLKGKATTEGAIEKVRRQLVDDYRQQGFVYTNVTAIIRGTQLQFIATEGYIASVKLDGQDIGPVGSQVLAFLDHLVGEKPLTVKSFERWLLLAQEIPGLTVRGTLNPSAGEAGAFELVAQVSRKPITGYLSADNRAFHLTGPEQGLAVMNFNSFTSLGERTQLTLYRAFNNTNNFGQALEEFYLGSSGLKFMIYGGDGETKPLDPLSAIGYFGVTRIAGTQLSYPLLRARAQSLNIMANLDLIDSEVYTNSGAQGQSTRVSFDNLRVLRLGADYAMRDDWLGGDMTAVDIATIRFSHGLPIMGGTQNGNPALARLHSRTDFFKINGDLSRTQQLYHWGETNSVALRTALGWQASPNAVPASERYYLGGTQYNRGFYYGEVAGDNAVSISTELQYNTTLPNVFNLPFDVKTQLYGFFDWGRAWQNSKTELDESLESFGGGSRFYIGERTEIDLEGVERVTRYPTGQSAAVSPLKRAAFYWQVLHRF